MRKLDLRKETVITGRYYLIYSYGLVAFGIGNKSSIKVMQEYNLGVSFDNFMVTVFDDDGEGITHFSYNWYYYELTEEEAIHCVMIPNI